MISPFTSADLHDAQRLTAEEPALLARVRWHLSTPDAIVLKASYDGALGGFACGTLHPGNAVVREVFVYPTFMGLGLGKELVAALSSAFTSRGTSSIVTDAYPGSQGFWQKLGFQRQVGLLRYADGSFINAGREEVIPLDPPHLLAVSHLYKMAFGLDRSAALREESTMGSAYMEGSQLRGFLLPLVGNGLIVAEEPEIGLELQRWLLPMTNSLVLPVGNLAAHAHLVHRRYTVEDAGTRMVYGSMPMVKPNMVFAYP